MTFREKVEKFFFEEVETERVLMDRNILILFAKLRGMFPVFKKNLLISFFHSNLQFWVPLIFLLLPRQKPSGNQLFFLLQKFFLAALDLTLKGIVIFYYMQRVISPED